MIDSTFESTNTSLFFYNGDLVISGSTSHLLGETLPTVGFFLIYDIDGVLTNLCNSNSATESTLPNGDEPSESNPSLVTSNSLPADTNIEPSV